MFQIAVEQDDVGNPQLCHQLSVLPAFGADQSHLDLLSEAGVCGYQPVHRSDQHIGRSMTVERSGMDDAHRRSRGPVLGLHGEILGVESLRYDRYVVVVEGAMTLPQTLLDPTMCYNYTVGGAQDLALKTLVKPRVNRRRIVFER